MAGYQTKVCVKILLWLFLFWFIFLLLFSINLSNKNLFCACGENYNTLYSLHPPTPPPPQKKKMVTKRSWFEGLMSALFFSFFFSLLFFFSFSAANICAKTKAVLSLQSGYVTASLPDEFLLCSVRVQSPQGIHCKMHALGWDCSVGRASK